MIGSQILYYEKVSSTNEMAEEMLSARNVNEGTVIYAGEQTRGKGQKGSTWVSEAGKNLTVSIILYPDFLPPEHQFAISQVLSLSIAGLLDNYSESISIKWPNDIYHKDDKIAGILIENSVEGNTLQYSIAGAGININQASFPNELPEAVSLKISNGKDYNIRSLLEELCNICDRWYNILSEGDLAYLNEQYQQRLYRYNTLTTFITTSGIIRGRIRGVDSHGKLIIKTTGGTSLKFSFKEVEIRK